MADDNIVQCNACGGMYTPIQTDGTRYFHACPDRKVVGVTPAPTKDNPAATAPVFAPIVNRRDENIVVGKDGKAAPKADGAGVTAVVDAAVIAAFTSAAEGV